MKIKRTTSISRSNTRMAAIHRCILVLLVAMTPNTYAAQNQQQSLQQDQGQGQQGQAQSQSHPQAQKQISKSQRLQKAQQVSQQNSKQRTQQQSDKKVPRSGSQKSNGKKMYASNKNETHEQMASNKDVRQFHEVLNDLLTEFSYDVKQGQINGLKNVSIRRVSISDALPKTYEQYVELLTTERIRENAKVRIINCIPCKSKSSVLSDGKLMISSPLTNVGRMDEAAAQLGIENFMDVILVYHTTHMVLAFSVFNTTSKEEVWSRTYNSETIRSRYQRLAIDMNQVEKSRDSDQYVPDYKFLLGIGGSQLPNVAGEARDKSFIAAHIRSVEKFNNRRFDFGLLSSMWINTSTFLKAYPSEGDSTSTTEEEYSGEPRPLPYKYVLGIHALAARNFLEDIESYDRIRYGIHVGVGGIISTGYLAPSIRMGIDTYFGRRWVVTLQAQYVLQSTILVGSEFQKAKSGIGGDLALSFNL